MSKLKRKVTKKRSTNTNTNTNTNINVTDEIEYHYNRLAELKSIIKSLDEEAKATQQFILESGEAFKSFDTEYGKLSLRTREKWIVEDKDIVIMNMGQNSYNEYSTISKSKIKECIGEKGVKGFIEDGTLELESTSRYYQLSIIN